MRSFAFALVARARVRRRQGGAIDGQARAAQVSEANAHRISPVGRTGGAHTSSATALDEAKISWSHEVYKKRARGEGVETGGS